VEGRPPSEATLIANARRSDVAAYAELVRMHQDTAFRIAYLITGSAADAEESAQDGFLKAHAALDRFDERRPFRPWLLQIVANDARNRRRARGRRDKVFLRLVEGSSGGVVLRAPGRWRYEVRSGRTRVGRGSLVVAPSPPVSRLPGATAFRACAGRRVLAHVDRRGVEAGALWVACKEESKLVRLDAATGALRATVSLPGSTPIAVVTGFGSIWALDSSGGALYRISPATNRISGRATLGVARRYNLWVGAGSLWSVDDGAGEVIPGDAPERMAWRPGRSGSPVGAPACYRSIRQPALSWPPSSWARQEGST
jgi:RNA polymerase sigma factor (sigma-70 family)